MYTVSTYGLYLTPESCRLRTLSSQGGATSPTKPLQTPTTPTANLAKKFKLAEFRYGKEELLQLYVESPEMPQNMASVPPITKVRPSVPLAFMPQTEEEQVRCFLTSSL